MLPLSIYSSIDTVKQHVTDGTIAARCDKCRRVMEQNARYTCLECSPSNNTYDLCGICLPNHDKQHKILNPLVRCKDYTEKSKLETTKGAAMIAAASYALFSTGSLIGNALDDGVITQAELIDIGAGIASFFSPIGHINLAFNVYEAVKTRDLSELNDSLSENLTSLGILSPQPDTTETLSVESSVVEVEIEISEETTTFFSSVVTTVLDSL